MSNIAVFSEIGDDSQTGQTRPQIGNSTTISRKHYLVFICKQTELNKPRSRENAKISLEGGEITTHHYELGRSDRDRCRSRPIE